MNLIIMLVALALSILAAQRRRPQLSYVGIGLLVVLLLLAPFLSNNKQTLTDMYILGLAGVGWNIIGGFTGYAAFGQVAFWGLGAYTAAVVVSVPVGDQKTLGWPIWSGFLMAMMVSALGALLIGIPVLRLKGHYFAIATLGIGIVMRTLFQNIDCVGNLVCLGGSTGLPTINPAVTKDSRDFTSGAIYFLTLASFAGAVGLTRLLSRSKFGYGLFAIRENEDAAGVLGVNTTWFKIGAFCLAAALTGLAGSWKAMEIGSVFPTEDSVFNPNISLYVIMVCLLGGVGTVWGPLIGAITYAAIRELLTGLQGVGGFGWVLDWNNVIFGAIVILLVVFLPRGISQLVGNKDGLSWRIFLRNVRENSI